MILNIIVNTNTQEKSLSLSLSKINKHIYIYICIHKLSNTNIQIYKLKKLNFNGGLSVPPFLHISFKVGLLSVGNIWLGTWALCELNLLSTFEWCMTKFVVIKKH